MKAARLTISLCHANCPTCGLPTELRLFESGPGGDFATFVGAASGAVYRLDLGKLHRMRIPMASLLAEAERTQGRLVRADEGVRCKICRAEFSPRSIMVDGEEIVDAFEL